MKLLVIAGFLGSGKTTLLLNIAQKLIQGSNKIVIIENEMGEIGIDGEYLRRNGLEVQELFGGCICCTLSLGLIETLEKVGKSYAPDIVILEATGAARPGDITANLKKFKGQEQKIQVITIVDASRFYMLMEMMEPLLTAQIEAGDIIVLNKIDSMTHTTIEDITGKIIGVKPGARVEAMSCENKAHIDGFMAHVDCYTEVLP